MHESVHGPSRHFAAKQRFVALGAQRTFARANAVDDPAAAGMPRVTEEDFELGRVFNGGVQKFRRATEIFRIFFADDRSRGVSRQPPRYFITISLTDVTLCFNDWCGAQVMIADRGVERVARLVLVSCEAFENYPPGLPGRLAAIAAKVPGALLVMRRTMAWRWVRELPMSFGHMTKRGIPDDIMRAWMRPLSQRAIRRDYCKYAGDTGRGKRDLLAATAALSTFDRPVLVVWASEDRIMPRAHGGRLVAAFPNSRLVEIADSYTLIPIDQPALLADHIREFIRLAPPAEPRAS